MAHPTLEYIRGLRKSLETKKAEIVGEAPSTIPGAEHDGKPDSNAKKPDPEVKDETMVPNSGLTTDGAGDDSKITHTSDLTAEQSALTPEKKPEVTDDADAKTAEKLAAEIIAGVDAWYAAKKEAEAPKKKEAEAPKKEAEAPKKEAAEPAKKAEDGVDSTKPTSGEPPSAGTGTAEALITDTGKEPEQTKDAIPPTKKPEITSDATVPATGEGSSGETAAAAKEAAECCKDGKCGKCAKCKAAAEAGADSAKKKAGALDMELTSDVLAKIAAVMLSTEEGTKLAESLLAKAAGAEAAEKTLGFLRDQNELAEKQAEYEAGQRDMVALLQKCAQEDAAAEAAAAEAADAAGGDDDGGITEIADTLDQMVESGEITEDEADQVVLELAQALAGEGDAGAAGTAGETAAEGGEAKEAQAAPAADAAAADQAAAGNAAIDQAVAVDPSQLDPNSVPQGGEDITADDVADALDTLVESGEITEDEADQLVQEIVGADGGADGAAGAGGDGEVSPEAIATALQDAVASGELKPEEVQQVLTELEGVPAPEDGAAAAPAAEAAPAAAAAAAPAAAAPTDEPKTAGAKLLAAINAARAARAAK